MMMCDDALASIIALSGIAFVTILFYRVCAFKKLPKATGQDKADKALAELTAGDRVKVLWPAMDQWYTGTIKDCTVQDGVHIHRIRYDDRHVEWRALGDQWCRWERVPVVRRHRRAPTSPVRMPAAAPTPSRPKVWLSPDYPSPNPNPSSSPSPSPNSNPNLPSPSPQPQWQER